MGPSEQGRGGWGEDGAVHADRVVRARAIRRDAHDAARAAERRVARQGPVRGRRFKNSTARTAVARRRLIWRAAAPPSVTRARRSAPYLAHSGVGGDSSIKAVMRVGTRVHRIMHRHRMPCCLRRMEELVSTSIGAHITPGGKLNSIPLVTVPRRAFVAHPRNQAQGGWPQSGTIASMHRWHTSLSIPESRPCA